MVTLQDIADHSGFSKTAVSHVLNGQSKKNRISEKTAMIIRGIAKDLGYQMDDLARAVSTGKANVIGFVMNPNSLEFSSPVLMSVLKKLFLHKYFVKIIHYEHEVTSAADLVEICLTQKLSGLISCVLPENILREMSEKLTAKKIPFAVAGTGYELEETIQVSANNYQGAGIVTKHLISLGHKKIGLIAENINTPYSIKKEKGFMDMMSEHGLEVPEEFLIVSEYKQERKALLEALMRKKDRPTAFFCLSDMYAISTIMTLAQNGFSVPDDVSVVGYANTMAASHCVPSLTTIDERYNLTGEIIADKILEKINNTACDISKQELVDVQLVVRESSAPVKII